MEHTNIADPANVDRWVCVTALRRIGQPENAAGPGAVIGEDVASLVAFLAGPDVAYITGQTIKSMAR